jgi:hypothetical protein
MAFEIIDNDDFVQKLERSGGWTMNDERWKMNDDRW